MTTPKTTLPRDPDVQLVLRGLPSSVPFTTRLRQALKCLLRRFDLRCVEVRDLPHEQQHPAPVVSDDDDAT